MSKLTNAIYERAERDYWHYVNQLNACNKSFTPKSFEQFRAENLTIQSVGSLVAFHNWLTPHRVAQYAKQQSTGA